jgi:phosphoribosyl-ATP pyrophosphohydrolase
MIDIEVLHRVSETLVARKEADPDSSYVSSLFHKGTDAICKKVAEEAAETIMAAKDKDLLHVVWEVTDLWFHYHDPARITSACPWTTCSPSSAAARACRASTRRSRGLPAKGIRAHAAIACSAASCGVRFPPTSSTKTSGCWRSTTSIPQRTGPCAGGSQEARRPRWPRPPRLNTEVALGRLMLAIANRIAVDQGSTDGFRSIINTGRVGLQEVYACAYAHS